MLSSSKPPPFYRKFRIELLLVFSLNLIISPFVTLWLLSALLENDFGDGLNSSDDFNRSAAYGSQSAKAGERPPDPAKRRQMRGSSQASVFLRHTIIRMQEMARSAVQPARMTTTQQAVFAGQNGEITIDTERKIAVVHDGKTPGGFPVDYELNLKRFGARGDGVTDDTAAFYSAVAVAKIRGETLFIPEGTYLLKTNGPVRQPDGTIEALEDFNGLTIRGMGRKSIIKTMPDEGGADVFQLNGVKNFTLRDIGIQSVIVGAGTEGSNGISITNGGENILIENCHFYAMPYKEAGGGVSTDGGQAITIQQTGDTPFRNIRIINNTADGGSYGFNYQGTGSSVIKNPIQGLIVRGNIFKKFYRGINVEISDTDLPAAPIDQMDIIFEGNSVIDCQQGILVNGSTGVNIIGNNVTSSYTGSPRFLSGVSSRFGAMMLSSHRCNFIGNKIHVADADDFMYVGGGFAGDANTPCTNVIVSNNNFFGATIGYGIKSSTTAAYKWASNSFFTNNRFQGAKMGGIDPALFQAENKNVIVDPSIASFPVIGGAVFDIGPNLLYNPKFDSPEGWVTSGHWTISDGKGVATGDEAQSIFQYVNLVAGRAYELRGTVSDWIGGTAGLFIYNEQTAEFQGSTTAIGANGRFTYVVVPTSTGKYMVGMRSSASPVTLKIDDVVCAEVPLRVFSNAYIDQLTLASIPVYSNNAAAAAGGMRIGGVYRTGTDPDRLCIVH